MQNAAFFRWEDVFRRSSAKVEHPINKETKDIFRRSSAKVEHPINKETNFGPKTLPSLS